MHIHPVFLIWTDSNVLFGAFARAVGSVIVYNKAYRQHPYTPLVLQHEAKHLAQQRSLGILTPLAYLFGMNMEGDPWTTEGNRTADPSMFSKGIDAMWLPPLPPTWSFITLTFNHVN